MSSRPTKVPDHPVSILSDSHQHLALHDYISVVSRRKWIVLAALLIVPTLAVAYSLSQSALYEATAKVLLTRQNLASSLTGATDPTASTEDQTVVQTQAEVARVPAIAERVLTEIPDLDMSPQQFLDASSVAAAVDSEILTFSVQDGDSELAAQAATEYADQYSAYRQDLDTGALQGAREEVSRRLAALEADGDEGSILYASLLRREGELKTLEALQTSNAQVIQTALEAEQVAPKTLRNGVIGLMLGALIGLGLAFLREALDTRVRHAEDIAARLEIPLLGRIPEPPKKVQAAERLVTFDEPAGTHAEAFRMLRTNIEFAMIDRDLRSVLVTSALAQEGKSTTAANLALAFARAGRHVILVDLDLRRPFVDRLFQQVGRQGISQVVLGRADLEDVLVPVPILPAAFNGSTPNREGDEPFAGGLQGAGRLELLTSGRIPPNPGELVASVALANILSELRERADLVLIDSPPMLQVGDAMTLSARADAMIVVTNLLMTHRGTLSELHRLLLTSRAQRLGFVLTGARAEAAYGYGYGFRQDFSERPAYEEEVS